MKKKISIITVLGAFALLLAGAIMLSSCEGPMGPAGPQGPAGADGQDGQDGVDGINGVNGQDGANGIDGVDGVNGIDGKDGTDGTDGVDGNAVCLICHNLTVKGEITAQYEMSGHAAASTLSRAGRVSCAKCHGHEGFVETAWTGRDTVAAAIAIPTRIQCKTCHDFHSSLDFENEPNTAIRVTDAVDLMTGDGTVEFEHDPQSNLCMNCHQSRRGPADDSDGAAPTTVGGHYGPHHGPQANFINGYGGYEFGVVLSTKGSHESMSSCVKCHMAETAAGSGEGGHTFKPSVEACTGCHSGATDFDINGRVTEIAGLLADLQAALLAAGMVDAEGHAIEDTTYQADSVGALWNYILISQEDMSQGVHNPAYAKALLNNSLNVFQ